MFSLKNEKQLKNYSLSLFEISSKKLFSYVENCLSFQKHQNIWAFSSSLDHLPFLTPLFPSFRGALHPSKGQCERFSTRQNVSLRLLMMNFMNISYIDVEIDYQCRGLRIQIESNLKESLKIVLITTQQFIINVVCYTSNIHRD